MLQTLVIDQTHSVHFPPISSSFKSVCTLFRRVKAEVRLIHKQNYLLCFVSLTVPQTPVSEACKSLCLSSHDYKLGRQFTIVGLNAAGSERKAAENLSVLFLDRSPGP